MSVALTSIYYANHVHCNEMDAAVNEMKKTWWGVQLFGKNLSLLYACRLAETNWAAFNYFKQAHQIRISNFVVLISAFIINLIVYLNTGTNFIITIIGLTLVVLISIIYSENVRSNYIKTGVDIYNKSLIIR